MPARRRFMRRLFRRSRETEAGAPAAALVARGLGEPPAPGSADDAELDSLRGELVRELDRLAAGSDSVRRS